MLGEGHLPEALIQQLPEDPSAAAWREEGWDVPATGAVGDMPAIGGAQEAWKFIKDLCLRHRGEVRVVQGSGEWITLGRPVAHGGIEPAV